MTKVLFLLVLLLPGGEVKLYSKPTANADACQEEIKKAEEVFKGQAYVAMCTSDLQQVDRTKFIS